MTHDAALAYLADLHAELDELEGDLAGEAELYEFTVVGTDPLLLVNGPCAVVVCNVGEKFGEHAAVLVLLEPPPPLPPSSPHSGWGRDRDAPRSVHRHRSTCLPLFSGSLGGLAPD
jgi:hypothetical protein